MPLIAILLIFLSGALTGAVALACLRGRAGAPGVLCRGDIGWEG